MSDNTTQPGVEAIYDCPIQPHVWRQFREIEPGERLELIAHVRQDESAPQVASFLREHLGHNAGAIFVFDVYVLVEVTFVDMVTTLLPLTSWADVLRRIMHLSDDELAQELLAAEARRADRTNNEFASAVREARRGSPTVRDKLSQEDYGRLRWLLDQFTAISLGLTPGDLRGILLQSAGRIPDQAGPVVSVSFNRWVEPAVVESRRTVKADAAELLFSVDCSTVTWAVVDTGIDSSHPMFAAESGAADAVTSSASRVIQAFDIPAGLRTMRGKLTNAFYHGIASDADWEEFAAAAEQAAELSRTTRFSTAANDHGTHVAGILAGRAQLRSTLPSRVLQELPGETPTELKGICPDLNVIDIQVFDEAGRGREFDVIVGLGLVAWLNRGPRKVIDGVNLSLSLPFAIDNFACGWTPVCRESERLVADGLVVVASAGNSGYDDGRGTMSSGAGFQLVSISDPGNAEGVITVGATHRTDPHRHGPISRSARGPTADGRNKPDILAPGDSIWGPLPNDGWGRKTGTSQAAPHVSGVAAMLLARYPELRHRPDRVKSILCDTATDLGRLVHFQGQGLVDALRALQRP